MWRYFIIKVDTYSAFLKLAVNVRLHICGSLETDFVCKLSAIHQVYLSWLLAIGSLVLQSTDRWLGTTSHESSGCHRADARVDIVAGTGALF